MRRILLSIAVACAAAGCATRTVERAQVRFLHWNVSHFGDGSASVATIRPGDGKAMAEKYSKFIGSVGADVVGLCSYDENFTTNGSMKSAEAVLPGYAKVVGPARGNMCNAVFYKPTALAKTDGRIVEFPMRYESAYYTAVKLEAGGVPVWFVQTHLDSHTYLSGHAKDREMQMKKLIEDFKDEPNVVIAGDFCVGIRIPGKRCFPAPEEYKVFEDAGYSLANLFGTGTYPVEHPLQPVDNIIMKGVSVSEVRFLEAERLSDHMAVSCLLTVYGEDR